MNLDKNTFGNSPAALYLSFHLNEQCDKKALRKISRFMNEIRVIANQALNAHFNGLLNTKSLYFVVDMLMERVKRDNTKVEGISDLARNLMSNVLIGELKSVKRRLKMTVLYNRAHQHVDKVAAQQANDTGKIHWKLIEPNVATVHMFNDPVNNDTLIMRSRKKLERLNKKSTLY